MNHDDFAEAISRLVGEAEDAGLEWQQVIAVLQEQADAMREAEAE